MEKAVLLSTNPIWCEKIFHIVNYAPSGEPISEKRFEVRKTRPKIETPFKVYVYETQEKRFKDIGVHWESGQTFEHHIGKVIGEFICDAVIEWHEDARPPVPLIKTCLSYSQIRRYWGHKEKIFLWHISNPKLYEKPLELSEFYRECEEPNCDDCPHLCVENTPDYYEIYCIYDEKIPITRPPQSWCYVEKTI